MAQHPTPFDENRRPFEKNEMFWGYLPPCKCCKVLDCFVHYTSYSEFMWETCTVLRVTTKKVVNFLHPWIWPFPPWKNPAGAMTAAACWWHIPWNTASPTLTFGSLDVVLSHIRFISSRGNVSPVIEVHGIVAQRTHIMLVACGCCCIYQTRTAWRHATVRWTTATRRRTRRWDASLTAGW